MCGIAGVFALGEELGPDDRADVRGMAKVLRHRGPDSLGFHDAPRAVLGNTRLNILDLSHDADLPMSNADGTVWIAYNGEVTNFRELEARYGLRGKYDFHCASDTEVLVHLYEELGIDFLHELTGMFAFALYDSRIQKAWIVRDFYGIRPLFLMEHGKRLYFASEIKSFLDLPGFRRDVNAEGIFHFLSLAYIPGRHTPFEQIDELQGGELVQVDLRSGTTSRRTYYRPAYDTDYSITEQDIVEPLHEEMRDSVRRNLISDAPLGLTLSGGFDTSSILTLAREVVGPKEDIHSFSIVMGEESYDESHFQHLMADYADTIHHEIRVGPREVMDHLVEHMAYMDEPSGDGAAVPSYILAKQAKEHVDVLLSGEGGDETFNAYETHVAWKARRMYRMAPRAARWLARKAAHALPCDYSKLSFDFVAKRFTTGSEMSAPEAHLYWRHTLDDPHQRALMPGCRDTPPTASLFAKSFEEAPYAEELDRISWLDIKYYFIGDLMVKNDRTMMAHSVEARFPYMDKKLHDFVSRIPPKLRLKGFKRRYIQKEAMKGRVPEAIYRRKNFGLEMPHSIWFLSDMKPFVDEWLSRDRVEATGLLDWATVSRLRQEHETRKRDHGRALWSILNLLIWFELFVHGQDYKRHLQTW